MKNIFFLFIFILLVGCSSTRLVNSWKNPEITSFKPDKLLVVGMAQNLNARSLFEEKLRSQLFLRNINAVKSLKIFDPEFTHSKKNEADISEAVNMIRDKGFDAVLVAAVKSVENKKVMDKGYDDIDYNVNRFENYYFLNQDIYHHPGYYEEYKVYHVESSLYNITSDSKRTLIWKGSIDMIDPTKVHNSVIEFVDRIIKSLEKEKLIKKI